ncbi:MAG: hypothetical protein IPN46_18485 [Saprospiraceae bacterium]|nr:hypothetical protein [Saprospiraceae bacterium]
MPIEIKFGTKTRKSVGRQRRPNKKEIKTESDNIINNPHPIWKKKPSNLTDEDYKNFYQELHPYSSPPLFWIHLNIDYPFNLTGILYFPKMNNSFEVQKNKIQLYSNQVFITDDVNCTNFLCCFMWCDRFTGNIPLNVSRSYLSKMRMSRKSIPIFPKKFTEIAVSFQY